MVAPGGVSGRPLRYGDHRCAGKSGRRPLLRASRRSG